MCAQTVDREEDKKRQGAKWYCQSKFWWRNSWEWIWFIPRWFSPSKSKIMYGLWDRRVYMSGETFQEQNIRKHQNNRENNTQGGGIPGNNLLDSLYQNENYRIEINKEDGCLDVNVVYSLFAHNLSLPKGVWLRNKATASASANGDVNFNVSANRNSKFQMLSRVCVDWEWANYQCSDVMDFFLLDIGSHQLYQAVKGPFWKWKRKGTKAVWLLE